MPKCSTNFHFIWEERAVLFYRVSYSVHEVVSVICFYRTVQKEANIEYLKLRHKIPAAVLFIFFAGQNLIQLQIQWSPLERRLHGLVYGFPSFQQVCLFLHGIKLGCNIWSPWKTVWDETNSFNILLRTSQVRITIITYFWLDVMNDLKWCDVM